VEDFADLRIPVPKKLSITQGQNLPGQTNFGLAQTRSRQGLPLLVNGVSCWVRSTQLLGLFDSEEEDEGIGIASDIFKVKGEDPVNPDCLREDWVRKYVGDSQSWVRNPLARS